LESTTNGADDMPRKPGPTLPLPTDTNGGNLQVRDLLGQFVAAITAP